MRYLVAGNTDTGCVRKLNEDSIFFSLHGDDSVIAVLADGMGGYQGGAAASQLCVQTVTQRLQNYLQQEDADCTPGNLESELLLSAQTANRAVFDARIEDEKLSRMGTTLVALVVCENRFSLIHAGDSRCYRFSSAAADNEQIDQLTRDDSVVRQMLDDGTITPEEMDRVPFKNVLSKAVGIESELNFSVASYDYKDTDALILCSDGLYNSVSEQKMAEVMAAPVSAEEKTDLLLKESLSQGATDNVSLIIIERCESKEVKDGDTCTTD